MKKKLLICLGFLCAGLALAETVINYKLPTDNASIAATSTNATAGTVLELTQPVGSARLYLTAAGDSSCTAGGTFIVDIATATGQEGVTNQFDTASLSLISLTLSGSMASATNTVSAPFNLSGIRYMRVARRRNTYGGAVTNVDVRVSASSGRNQP